MSFLFHGMKDFPNDDTLVKRVFLTLDLLIIFVTLACEDNNVAGLCVFNAPADGFAAVGNFNVFAVGLCKADLECPLKYRAHFRNGSYLP